MGIESDQLVYDYLSQVGDLAQQRGLPPGDRVRLVAELRADIDRRRSAAGATTPSGVKRVLSRCGSPAEVVTAAGGRSAPAPDVPSAVAGDGGSGDAEAAGGRRGTDRAGGGLLPQWPGRGARESVSGLAGRLAGGRPDTAGGRSDAGGGRRASAARDTDRAEAPATGPPERTDQAVEAVTEPADEAGDPAAPGDAQGDAGPAAGTPFTGPAKPRTGGGGFLTGGLFKRGADRPVAEEAGRPGERGVPVPRSGAASPHLAGMDELGPRESNPRWWETDGLATGPFESDGPLGPAVRETGQVAGFVGGIEVPDLLRPPSDDAADGEPTPDTRETREDEPPDGGEQVDAPGSKARRRFRLRRRSKEGGERVPTRLLPMLAAVLLLVGALIGNWIALGLGWLTAYGTRSLSQNESKWAVMGMPGLVAIGALVWLGGRANGQWGADIPEDGMGDVVAGAWPVVVRAAAVASALFLVWRARRQPRG